jgi:ribosomal subunit interface protein
MEIRVSGHQVDVGETLTAHVEDRLQATADKYFARAISAQVTFGKGPHDNGFTCDIVAHVIKGLVLKSRHDAQEALVAFNGAADRIDKQLRRYMRRLKDHHNVDMAERIEAAVPNDNARYTLFQDQRDEEAEAPEAPLIVAETRVDVPEASVSDAVMMLDLRHTNALLFKNAGTGLHNMVYRRGDGTIGWVEPH